jgi:hypothetical protein
MHGRRDDIYGTASTQVPASTELKAGHDNHHISTNCGLLRLGLIKRVAGAALCMSVAAAVSCADSLSTYKLTRPRAHRPVPSFEHWRPVQQRRGPGWPEYIRSTTRRPDARARRNSRTVPRLRSCTTSCACCSRSTIACGSGSSSIRYACVPNRKSKVKA